jgi:hypothetical protein
MRVTSSLISRCIIWLSYQYSVESEKFEAPSYAIFPSSCLFLPLGPSVHVGFCTQTLAVYVFYISAMLLSASVFQGYVKFLCYIIWVTAVFWLLDPISY